MFLDPLEEPLLLGRELLHLAPMQRAPDKIAEEGPDQPAGAHAGESCQSQRYHRVEGDDAHDGVLQCGIGGQRAHGAEGRGCGAEDGGGEGVPSAGGAEAEEGVPIEGGGRLWGLGDRR